MTDTTFILKNAAKKVVSVIIVIAVVLVCFYNLWLKHQYTVPILMYHGVNEGSNESLSVSPDNFKRQIAYIKWRGYDVISLDELVEGINSGKKFKHNTVVITFDDGYQDNYKNAYPVLKNYSFPATIFLISDYIDTKQGHLKWNQIKEMLAESKITFGGHTKTDTYLPEARNSAHLRNEIVICKKDIEVNTGEEVKYFCYPTGGFTQAAKEIIKEAGYKGACTTNRGFVRLNKDVYELKRIKIKNSDLVEKPLSFWAKLSGYYNIFRKGKNPY